MKKFFCGEMNIQEDTTIQQLPCINGKPAVQRDFSGFPYGLQLSTPISPLAPPQIWKLEEKHLLFLE